VGRYILRAMALSRVYRLFLCAAALALCAALPRIVAAHPAATSLPAAAVLRPGTAAGLLGLSSLVADFDADGKPDLAIADRRNRVSGSDYRIEVRLSHGVTQTVSFLSTRGAVKIAAFDVDNDRDQDLVVTPVLSREVVGIWVNDGAGHFDAGALVPFVSLAERLTSSPRSLSPSADQVLSLLIGRRIDPRAPPRTVTILPPGATAAPILSSPPDTPSQAFASAAGPRAPPSQHC